MKLLKRGEIPTREHVNTLIREIKELRRTAKEKTELTGKPDPYVTADKFKAEIDRINGWLDSLQARSRP